MVAAIVIVDFLNINYRYEADLAGVRSGKSLNDSLVFHSVKQFISSVIVI